MNIFVYFGRSALIFILITNFVSAGITGDELKNLTKDFEVIASFLNRVGEKNKIKSPYTKDIAKILKAFDTKDLSQESLKNIIDTLSEDKYKLENEDDQDLEVTLQIGPGLRITQKLKILTNTLFTDYLNQLKSYKLASQSPSAPTLSQKKLDEIRADFRPVFNMFYDLYKRNYYKNLDRIRMILHQPVVTKDNLQEILSILKWKKLRLQEENQNQLIVVPPDRNALPLKNVSRNILDNYIQKIEMLINQI